MAFPCRLYIQLICLNGQEEMAKYSSYEHERQTIPKIAVISI